MTPQAGFLTHGSRGVLLPQRPPHAFPSTGQWLMGGELPIHSGGTVPDLHRLPFSPVSGT